MRARRSSRATRPIPFISRRQIKAHSHLAVSLLGLSLRDGIHAADPLHFHPPPVVDRRRRHAKLRPLSSSLRCVTPPGRQRSAVRPLSARFGGTRGPAGLQGQVCTGCRDSPMAVCVAPHCAENGRFSYRVELNRQTSLPSRSTAKRCLILNCLDVTQPYTGAYKAYDKLASVGGV